MNSSISSSERPAGGADPWRRFLARLLLAAAGLAAAVFLFVAVLDPFDTLNLSPPFDRSPITTNARYGFPALTRKPSFDSMILGTSTSRLLRPAELDPLFDAHFVNLAMNSATAYEQWRLGSLFMRHHPQAKVALIGLDLVWCETGGSAPRYTERPFPEWMYDDNPWNDYLGQFSLYAVEQAGVQFAVLTGLQKRRYGRDGYTNFLPDDSLYDLERARRKIYGPAGRGDLTPVPAQMSAAERQALTFPALPLLQQLLAEMPQTTALVFFVPYHVWEQGAPGTRQELISAECKERVAAIVKAAPKARLVDFMIASAVTSRDDNYWDALHYRSSVSTWLAQQLRAAADGPPRAEEGYVVR